jgi:uracil phosphoribosyltransferase
VVAPEREGRILTQSMHMLRAGRDLTPHAKRIPFEHGLLVGVSKCSAASNGRPLLFLDGAIASGATLITLLDLLAVPGVPVDICSVHAAGEGVRSIARYAAASRLSVRIYAGHVTEGLSPKFYAVCPSTSELVVGDLGDTIAPVAVER